MNNTSPKNTPKNHPIPKRLGYRNRQEVLDGLASIIEELVDQIGNFAVAEPYYHDGDGYTFLEKMFGKGSWDCFRLEGESDEDLIYRAHDEISQTDYFIKLYVVNMNRLAADDDFINAHIGTNRGILWKDATKFRT